MNEALKWRVENNLYFSGTRGRRSAICETVAWR